MQNKLRNTNIMDTNHLLDTLTFCMLIEPIE